MLPTLMAILVLLIILTAAVALARSTMGLWLDYRLRIAALESSVGRDALNPDEESEAVLAKYGPDASRERGRNRLQTGLLIVWLGVGCVVAGRVLRSGTLAVGLDMGGWIALVLGIVIALMGYVVLRISRKVSKAGGRVQG